MTEADGKYLASFCELDNLSMNQCHLLSLEHLPALEKLTRLELAENSIKGDELKHLVKYANTLEVLKLANNKISKLEDLEPLKALTKLKNLDLDMNDVTEVAGYKDKVWQMFKDLQVLDRFNKEGEEVSSDDLDYDDEGFPN